MLRLGNANGLPTGGTWTIADAAGPSAIDLNGFTWTSGAITFGGSNGTATSQGNILLGGGTLTLGGTLTYSVTGNPQGAVIAGSGTLALSAARTFAVGDSTGVPSSAYELTVNAPVTGAFNLTKQGSGNVLLAANNTFGGLVAQSTSPSASLVLTGDNTGLTGTTTLNSGTLLLDYTGSNTPKINPSGTLSLLGGTLRLNGSAAGATSQAVASTTFAAGSFATVNMNPGAGQTLALDLKALTRAAGAGTVRFNLSGTQSLANGVLTSTANDATTGLLGTGGGWATVTLGGQTNFATVSGGFITAITPSVQNDLGTLLTAGAATGNPNLTDSTGYTGTLDRETALNSIRFNGSGASAIVIPNGGLLRIDSGGILQTGAVGGTTSISGGDAHSSSSIVRSRWFLERCP